MTVPAGWKIRLALAVCMLAGMGGSAHAEDAEQCLARTVYFEARGDGADSMAAVAAVVMNRVRHPDFPDTVCAVVKQGGESPPCQFSYWCDGRSDRPTNEELWRLARRIARRALDGKLGDPVKGALFFHDKGIKKPFGKNRKYVTTVGSLLFYR